MALGFLFVTLYHQDCSFNIYQATQAIRSTGGGFQLYYFVLTFGEDFLLLMAEILHHLGCMKPL